MKRHFIKKPVTASSSFWSTDVTSFSDIRQEIQKALDAGTTLEDVDDYLNELYNLGTINDEEFSELINWANISIKNQFAPNQPVNETEKKVVLDLFADAGVSVVESYFGYRLEEATGLKVHTFIVKYSSNTDADSLATLEEYLSELHLGYELGFDSYPEENKIEVYHYL